MDENTNLPPTAPALGPAARAIFGETWVITSDWMQVIAARAMHLSPSLLQFPDKPPARAQHDAFFAAATGPAKSLPGGDGAALLTEGVAVIPITGPIFPRANMMTQHSGATSLVSLRQNVAAALNNPDVGAIVYAIDSPGGAVSGTAAMADVLYQARGKKPTMGCISGMGCSGAYWLGTQMDRLVLDRTGMVGSIGVITAVPKQVNADQSGNVWVDIVSSNAPNKRPDPTTEEGLGEVQAVLNAVENQFVADVARGRNVSVQTVRETFGRGGVKVGGEAVKLGMVDGLSTLEASVGRMARLVRATKSQRQ